MRLNFSFEVKPHRVSRVCFCNSKLLQAFIRRQLDLLSFRGVRDCQVQSAVASQIGGWGYYTSNEDYTSKESKLSVARVSQHLNRPSCVWKSPIRLPRSGKVPCSPQARLAVRHHVFPSRCCVITNPGSPDPPHRRSRKNFVARQFALMA